MKIINLTQHLTSVEQLQAGVFEPADKDTVKALLTFDSLPTMGKIRVRASALAVIALNEVGKGGTVMIGGAPYLMGMLEDELRLNQMHPVYAFSERVSVEKEDGTKVSVFKHVGFVNPYGE